MASAVKTLAVAIKVVVREGESAQEAFRRLRKLLWRSRRQNAYLPPAGKKSVRYYQKPSELERQRKHRDQIRKRNNWNKFVGKAANRWRSHWWMTQSSRI